VSFLKWKYFSLILAIISMLILACCGGGGGYEQFYTAAVAAVPTPSCGTNCSGDLPVENPQNVWTVNTPSCECINYAIKNAKAGATINVTAGSGSVTWPGGAVTIPANKPLKIMGPGRDNLTIILGGHYVFSIDPYVGTPLLPAARISGFKFVSPYEAKRVAIHSRGQGWRIDHCAYEGIESTTVSSTSEFVFASANNTTIESTGLIDNNIIINGKILNGGFGSFSKMSGVWATAPVLGTGGTVYVEDNYIISNKAERKLMMDTNYGGRYVFRYNTVVNGWTLAHSLQDDASRGPRSWELYGNTFNTIGSGQGIGVHAGTGVIFNNAMSGTHSGGVLFGNERSNFTIGAAGKCDGTSQWDGNLDATGWPCRDQIGTGTDASLWSDRTVLPGPAQSLSPAYTWGNFSNATPIYPNVDLEAPTHIKENRDYYRHDTTNCAAGGASCSKGMGCGTLANRPAACTTGVGYWATNQSCSDMTGMVGANPSTPIAGTLYKCTATNTWTAYYTPYTYPHPLRR
jgi:hypothetical protein